MAMAWVWTVMAAAAVIFGALTGRMAQVGAAALEGARSAVELCLSMAGVVCLFFPFYNQCIKISSRTLRR